MIRPIMSYFSHISTLSLSTELKNLAYGKHTESRSQDPSYPSSKAVDGNKNTKVFDGFCFRSQTHYSTQWWSVNLGGAALISTVSITNGGGEYPTNAKRLANIDIRIGFKDQPVLNPVCQNNVTIQEPVTVNLRCAMEMTGQYVYIERAGSLIICEVEVLGVYI